MPEKALIKTDSHYTLTTKEGVTEGTKFSSDIFLVPGTAPKGSEGVDKFN